MHGYALLVTNSMFIFSSWLPPNKCLCNGKIKIIGGILLVFKIDKKLIENLTFILPSWLLPNCNISDQQH
jgi:hypothetical protein